MNNLTIKFVFDRKKRAVNGRPGTVELEMTHDRKQKRISTGVKVFPKQWSNEFRVINHPEKDALNARLSLFKKSIEEAIIKMEINGVEFSFANLDALLARKKHGESFLQYMKSRIEKRSDITLSTRKNHRTLHAILSKYKKITAFDDLTPSNIRAFDFWLHKQEYRQTTIGKFHSILKCYVHDAMSYELLERDPYVGIKIEKGKSRDRKYLTEEELARLMALQPDDASIERARDIFVFQAFTGLAYSDLERFDFDNVEIRNGKHVVRDKRKKTAEQYYIVLLSPALAILEKYNYKLPLITLQKYNMALKSFGILLGKHITSHCARHTFATWCLNKGVGIDVLARFLGHSSTKSTEIYAKIVDKTIESTFDMLESKI